MREATQESRKFDPRRVRYSYVRNRREGGEHDRIAVITWNREGNEDDRIAVITPENLEVFAEELDWGAYDAAMETWRANPQGAEPRRWQSFRANSSVADYLTHRLNEIVETQNKLSDTKSTAFTPPAYLHPWEPFLVGPAYYGAASIRAEELAAVAEGLANQELLLKPLDSRNPTPPEMLQATVSLLNQYQTVVYQD
ncbi:MAG TPA: hypothetical protein VJR27_00560 [Candidatus Saccharimonadales bacterium]|nr:hypothetical protein [Candidatus Saccharimonadales bacterium]